MIDARLKGQITRGERIRALITQPRFHPLRTIDEVVLLKALDDGVFDTAPPHLLTTIREQLPAWLDAQQAPPGDMLNGPAALAETALQLQSVIGAMSGVAAERAHDAHARLPGVRACAAIIGAAISAVLSAEATRPRGGTAEVPAKSRVVIVLCSEQGFVGAYNAQILDRARR